MLDYDFMIVSNTNVRQCRYFPSASNVNTRSNYSLSKILAG